MAEEESGSERTCIATGDAFPKSELIRFVVSPEGQVVPDLQGKLPGRGIWVRARRDALELAVKKQLFSRGAKKKVTASQDLPERVASLLHSDIVHWLGLARKAGAAIAGFDKVSEALRQGKVQLLLMAADARGDAEKIQRLAQDVTVWTMLSRQSLGQVMGRDEAVYLAITRSDFGQKIMEKCHRYTGFVENNAL